ncbi:MAG: 3-oxoadipate enol-lactonase [Rhizobiales bacterium]|nr:3-oxoadipate enol-lactonase [Hyphomicrobiales bacterium]
MSQFLKIDNNNGDALVLHYRFREGEAGIKPIVFANSLGTDFRIWDGVIDLLPANIPVLCFDKRGHGLSEILDQTGLTSIEQLAGDMAALMDHFKIKDATICGVSVGGMIAQSLSASRPDLIRAAVFSNTSYKMGTVDNWNPRIGAVRDTGIEPMSDMILERWFSKKFISEKPSDYLGYKAMLVRTHAEGYARVCEAIRDANFEEQCSKITQPSICIAGSDDLGTTPDVVEKLANALPNSQFRVLSDVGHLPCIEAPQKIVDALKDLEAF